MRKSSKKRILIKKNKNRKLLLHLKNNKSRIFNNNNKVVNKKPILTLKYIMRKIIKRKK
jgi:hypothetical protein